MNPGLLFVLPADDYRVDLRYTRYLFFLATVPEILHDKS